MGLFDFLKKKKNVEAAPAPAPVVEEAPAVVECVEEVECVAPVAEEAPATEECENAEESEEPHSSQPEEPAIEEEPAPSKPMMEKKDDLYNTFANTAAGRLYDLSQTGDNPSEALAYLKQAADMGHALAQFELAAVLIEENKLDDAKKYLTLSKKGGIKEADELLNSL